MKILSKIKEIGITAELFLFSLSYQKESDVKKYIVFDTSMGSENVGDQIINDYCNKIFDEIGLTISSRIPTHVSPNLQEERCLTPDSLKIITGTNILSPKLHLTGLWHRPSKLKMQTNLLLMGNGWSEYSKKVSLFTKMFYRKMLNGNLLHSVRDEYTANELRKIGVQNVINTGCPTMWRLTPEFCEDIPIDKAENVITTVTDYSPDDKLDFMMLDILIKSYNKVFVWIQGRDDLEYLKKYKNFEQLIFIDNNLASYDNILKSEKSLDYVGTRLHAGIRALNNKRRSLIIAIDNRAIEISRDTALPIIMRNEIEEKLEQLIHNKIYTKINLPLDAINKWKHQFLEGEKCKMEEELPNL
ncbi:polysaccharide pyruvyl transferase family protein [uncultured Clostridium sp.]|uniref:polysaccharide pyruvyl transferase family protein n=1 Tax=uncultured Clostridium sp. TaxID=59620 RepID=UPI0025E39075|nr:polysaccharide pyruvyl transferase family protein [uncultured Clostridium sp.]